jgi:hypothetical protein
VIEIGRSLIMRVVSFMSSHSNPAALTLFSPSFFFSPLSSTALVERVASRSTTATDTKLLDCLSSDCDEKKEPHLRPIFPANQTIGYDVKGVQQWKDQRKYQRWWRHAESWRKYSPRWVFIGMAASLGLHHWTIEDLHAVRQAQEILALEGKKDRHEYRRAEGDEGF